MVSIFQLNTNLVFEESSLKHCFHVPLVILVQPPGIFRVGDIGIRDIFISFLGLEDIEIYRVHIECLLPSILDLLMVLVWISIGIFLIVEVRNLLLRSGRLLESLIWMVEHGLDILIQVLLLELSVNLHLVIVAAFGRCISILALDVLLIFQLHQSLLIGVVVFAIDPLRISGHLLLRSLLCHILVLALHDVSESFIKLLLNILRMLDAAANVVGDELLALLHGLLVIISLLIDLLQSNLQLSLKISSSLICLFSLLLPVIHLCQNDSFWRWAVGIDWILAELIISHITEWIWQFWFGDCLIFLSHEQQCFGPKIIIDILLEFLICQWEVDQPSSCHHGLVIMLILISGPTSIISYGLNVWAAQCIGCEERAAVFEAGEWMAAFVLNVNSIALSEQLDIMHELWSE